MLFTKEITKITYQNVVEFCNQQISESINLDYKKDFPSDLEKTISAFANTMGGLIIIGVEDKDGKPKLPVRGLKYEKGFSERVTSIIISNIYPPVFPEIQVCNPIRNKTFIVIRIPQSNMTPHSIRHRTQIYIRTGNITKLEELAPIEKIEWLRDKRKKSEELRKLLRANALERYNNYLIFHKLTGVLFGEATISIVPLYPAEPYKSSQEIKQISEEIIARGYDGDEFPCLRYGRTKPVQGGIARFLYNKETQYIQYTEFNQFGLIFHKEDLGNLKEEKVKKEGEKTEAVKKVYFFEILRLIDLFLEASANFYEKLGYWGLVEFQFSLEKLLGVKPIRLDERQIIPPWEKDEVVMDNRLKWKKEYYVNEIKNKGPELLIELVKDIGWALGWDFVTEDMIKKFLIKANRFSR